MKHETKPNGSDFGTGTAIEIRIVTRDRLANAFCDHVGAVFLRPANRAATNQDLLIELGLGRPVVVVSDEQFSEPEFKEFVRRSRKASGSDSTSVFVRSEFVAEHAHCVDAR